MAVQIESSTVVVRCRPRVGVPREDLRVAQLDPCVERRCHRRVTERVRVDAPVDAGLEREALDPLVSAGAALPVARAGHDERAGRAVSSSLLEDSQHGLEPGILVC